MAELVLDFGTVSREIRGIVARRRSLMLFLGSLFAAMSMFLQRVLDADLPVAFQGIEHRAFLAHALLVLAPCIVIALRVAKLHSGMVINGVFYCKLEQSLGKPSSPEHAARLNIFGVSAALFYLVALLAAGEAGVLTLALHRPGLQAAGVSIVVFLLLAALFYRFHRKAAKFALGAIQHCRTEPLTQEELEDHWAESRGDCNHDLITLNSFAGLMLFSTLENITGFGSIAAAGAELTAADVQQQGPKIYSSLLVVVCVAAITMYLRLSTAIAKFSVQLDPTDLPYRPFKLTDTYLGYLLIVFFLVVAVHLTGIAWGIHPPRLLVAADAAAALAPLSAYPLALVRAGRKQRKS